MLRTIKTLSCWLALGGVGLLLSAAVGSAAPLPNDGEFWEYSNGHADIGVLYEDGELRLHWHFGGGTTVNGEALPGGWSGGGGAIVRYEWSPTSAYVRVPDSVKFDAAFAASLPPTYGFIGHNGNEFWVLPWTNEAGAPYLGFATESVDGGDPFASVGALWPGGFTFELVDVVGPGEFSLWQLGSFGDVVPIMATVDGIDSSDALAIPAGTHSHYNWGFTEEGIYEVTLKASGTHITDGYFEDTATFFFAVGDNTAFSVNGMPEPSAWALGGVGLIALGFVAVRRRRQAARLLLFLGGLPLVAATALPATAAPLEYTAAHADIRPVYENGEMALKYRFDQQAVLNGVPNVSPTFNAPHEAYVRVPDSTLADPGDPTIAAFFTFFPAVFQALGSPSEPFWVLPQNNVSGQPFFGFSTEELNFTEWGASFEIALTNFSGPGHFALYQAGFPPAVKLSTANGQDSFVYPWGHDHYNWVFTEAGVYELEFTITGTHLTDGEKSASGTFFFAVGDATAFSVSSVPEPSAWALGGLGLLGVGKMTVRCRRRTSAPCEA